MERDGSRDSADLCGSQCVCEREKDARAKWRDEDEVRTETEETDKASSSLVAQVSPVLSYRVDPTPAPARPHALILPAAANTAPRPGPTSADPRGCPAGAPRARSAGGEGAASERASEGGAGKVFHEAVAFFHLVFSSLTRVPAPVRVQAGGASTGSPSARGAGTPEPGAGRGAVPAPAHGCSRPARTPSRRAQLARGPSAALCCAPPPPEPGSC
ncbi:skin secretory protein xP2-like [Ovis aries]|uniref:skin secretory protein xP2-like n=1 Tax=Ovis aries TaxID=9940 RepID=UPI001C2E39AC|nr:skin secretory protein xP2-like [Ovis aries]